MSTSPENLISTIAAHERLYLSPGRTPRRDNTPTPAHLKLQAVKRDAITVFQSGRCKPFNYVISKRTVIGESWVRWIAVELKPRQWYLTFASTNRPPTAGKYAPTPTQPVVARMEV